MSELCGTHEGPLYVFLSSKMNVIGFRHMSSKFILSLSYFKIFVIFLLLSLKPEQRRKVGYVGYIDNQCKHFVTTQTS